MAKPIQSRYLLPAIPAGVCLLIAMGGCSHPLEVDVPANVHGRVLVLCDTFTTASAPIRVNTQGIAEHAACPQTQTSLVVVRAGQPVKPAGAPHWSTTGDGILLSVEFEVP